MRSITPLDHAEVHMEELAEHTPPFRDATLTLSRQPLSVSACLRPRKPCLPLHGSRIPCLHLTAGRGLAIKRIPIFGIIARRPTRWRQPQRFGKTSEYGKNSRCESTVLCPNISPDVGERNTGTAGK